jgi:hypothetical protein
MKFPFVDLPNNALGHYFIQLPLYGKLILKMLEGTKYEKIRIYGGIVVLLKDDGDYEEFRIPKQTLTTVLEMDICKFLKK